VSPRSLPRKARRASPASRGSGRWEGRQLVILTGLSGSGKGSVLNTFEDLGYYCVDNLPVDLILSFTELYAGSGEIERAALLVDAREGGQISRLPAIMRRLRREHPAVLVFIEASDEALLRRFSETRRPHPLARSLTVREGIRRERKMMTPIRQLADVVIDTTRFNVHELRHFITQRFQKPGHRPLVVSVVSFGYRSGVPADADLVFDVRFLPNPHFVPAFRPHSGKHPRVARYIRSFPQTGEFAAYRGPAGLPDPALHPRGEKLFDDRLRMHRRAPSLRDDGGRGSQGAGAPRLFRQGRPPRYGPLGRLTIAGAARSVENL